MQNITKTWGTFLENQTKVISERRLSRLKTQCGQCFLFFLLLLPWFPCPALPGFADDYGLALCVDCWTLELIWKTRWLNSCINLGPMSSFSLVIWKRSVFLSLVTLSKISPFSFLNLTFDRVYISQHQTKSQHFCLHKSERRDIGQRFFFLVCVTAWSGSKFEMCRDAFAGYLPLWGLAWIDLCTCASIRWKWPAMLIVWSALGCAHRLLIGLQRSSCCPSFPIPPWFDFSLLI